MNTLSFHSERRLEVVYRVLGVIPDDFPRCADIGTFGIVINNVAKVEAFFMLEKILTLFLKKAQNCGVDFSWVCQAKVIPSVGVEWSTSSSRRR